MVHMKTAKCPTCGGMVFKLPGKAAKLCYDECLDCRHKRENEAEAAYERHQQSLTESGGPDDSAYRANLIAAGRGHLVKP